MNIKQELKELLVKELNIADLNPSDIGDDDIIFSEEGLGLDSLDAVELVVILKKKYQINLKDMEIAKKAFRSVSTLADYILSERPDLK